MNVKHGEFLNVEILYVIFACLKNLEQITRVCV